ncbi:MAG: mitochondrial carrier domain-containing protein [Benjaminiella poitrasii]|nr:MAG: mitochondrial carrier domain-containing protein [Benjaminiella poitrasii]
MANMRSNESPINVTAINAVDSHQQLKWSTSARQAQLAETSTEEDQRIRGLFNKLDKFHKGTLDSETIRSIFDLPIDSQARQDYAEELLTLCDTSQDGLVDYNEFKAFVKDKESRLLELFTEIDRNGEGQLDSTDFQMAFKNSGIDISLVETTNFMQTIDVDRNGLVDFNEFKTFLLLLPRTNMAEIYRFYKFSLDRPKPIVIPTRDETGRNALNYLLAGGLAGAVSRTFTAPFDRLKVFLITQHNGATAQKRHVLNNAIRSIYHHGGWKGFFTGNGLNVMKIMPESAIKFYSYEACKEYFANVYHCDTKDSIPVHARFLSGGIAGVCAQFSIYPVETLKTRIMTCQTYGNMATTVNSYSRVNKSTGGLSSKALYSSLAASNHNITCSFLRKTPSNSVVVETARLMYARGGIRAFWPGLTLGLIGVFPYQAMDLGIYETLKEGYLRYNASQCDVNDLPKQPNIFVLWTCGMISGAIGATSVYPLNVVRTRLQAQGTKGHPRLYKSPWDAVQVTFAEEGVKGFYKGLGPTLLKVVPAVSISYVTYEWSKRKLCY